MDLQYYMQWYKGDAPSINFSYWDEDDGDPVDISLCSFTFEVRTEEWEDPLLTKTLASGITISGAAGTGIIQIDAVDFESFPPLKTTLLWKLIKSYSGQVEIENGKIDIIPDVTNTDPVEE